MSRARLPQIHSITDGSFEPSKKNPISLGDDDVLSTDSKPIKIGEKTSILELSEDSLIVRGALEFDTLLRGILNSPNERMAFTAKTGEYRFYSTHSDEDYVRMYVLGGNCLIEAVDADGGVEADIQLDAGNDIILDAATGNFKLHYNGDTDDLCTLSVAANGATTIATQDSDGTAGNLTLDIDGDIELNADGGQVSIKDGSASHFLFDCDYTAFTIYDDTDAADLFRITVGASGITTIATVDDGATVGHLTLAPDGDLVLDPASRKTIINATDALYFDGGGDTYISESSADVLDIMVGNDLIFQITNSGADGNTIDIDRACIGFRQEAPIYDASSTIVDFRHSNKQFVTFGSGNITNLELRFPLVSGNFVCLIKQDGIGSRTITNYKAMEFDETSADGSQSVKWAGGSNPTLTTDANHVDILSFYWDADNEIAYGVATLDFQF